MKNYVLTDLLLYFFIYSFAGWILETVYASVRKKKFVNRGFLRGPFCPVYGFGSIIIILSSAWVDNSLAAAPGIHFLAVKILVAAILATVLEYFTGYALEKLFGCKWWDYSENFLNLQGKVCLKFSLLWGLLAYILTEIIHPRVAGFISSLPLFTKAAATSILAIYLVTDTVKSTGDILNLIKIVLAYDKNPLEKPLRLSTGTKEFFRLSRSFIL